MSDIDIPNYQIPDYDINGVRIGGGGGGGGGTSPAGTGAGLYATVYRYPDTGIFFSQNEQDRLTLVVFGAVALSGVTLQVLQYGAPVAPPNGYNNYTSPVAVGDFQVGEVDVTETPFASARVLFDARTMAHGAYVGVFSSRVTDIHGVVSALVTPFNLFVQ